MARFLLGRALWAVVVLWFVVTAAFVITNVIPGDPVRMMLGPHAAPDTVETVRKELGLDRPMVVQYVRYVGRVVDGNLGRSYRLDKPVTKILKNAVWPTLQLALGALFLQLLLGVPLGVIAALRRNRAADVIAQTVALLGQSAPTFFLGPVFIYLFAYRLGWFPIGGYGDGGTFDRLHHLVLPALTLAAGGTAIYTRLVRSDLIEQLGEDYVRTARAKGASPARVVGRHALRNALLPLVTLVGLDLGVLMAGAIVTEYIFQWPGLGRETVQSILYLDPPVVLGVVIVVAAAIVVANLAVDVIYAWLDPRVRRA